MTVHQCVSYIICAALRVQDVHCTEVLVWCTYAYNLLCSLQCGGKLSVNTSDESVSLTCLNHHHTEVVAVKHFIVSLLEVVTLTLTFVCQHLSVALTTLALVVMTQVHNLHALKVQVKLSSLLLYHLCVTEQHWSTEAFFLSLNGSLDHCWVQSLGEYYALWVLTCCLIEVLCNACLLSHAQTQVTLVSVPVGNLLTSHT